MSFSGRKPRELFGIRDSKKLSRKKREEWFDLLKKYKKEGKCNYKVVYASHRDIDIHGISAMISRCVQKALCSLGVSPQESHILLDGSLYAPQEYIHQETIIKGDDKESVISAASVVAKCSRDAKMVRCGAQYPLYGFEIHKGYGTQAHYKALYRHGPSSIHRKSFIRPRA